MKKNIKGDILHEGLALGLMSSKAGQCHILLRSRNDTH